MKAHLDGYDLIFIIKKAKEALDRSRSLINSLNVFPVPDGDTGTNMAYTMTSAWMEVSKCPSRNVGDVARRLSLGCLMGARGNSGVILSQIWRGMANSIEGKSEISSGELAGALEDGVRTAYKSVMKPVEGTILTVAREAARGASEAARRGAGIVKLWEAALERATSALERTPQMLPALKEAGVVDAGGKGFTCILEAAASYFHDSVERNIESGELGFDMDIESCIDTENVQSIRVNLPSGALSDLGGSLYDVQALIMMKDGSCINIPDLNETLRQLGDSLVISGADDLLRVHIHTKSPGRVLDELQKHGLMTDIVVENLDLQCQSAGVHEKRCTDFSSPGIAPTEPQILPPGHTASKGSRRSGAVSVAAGDGVAAIMKSLGCDEVIDGGETMNPSTEEFLNAILRVSSKGVILIPNSRNAFLAARQAASMTDKVVEVLPSGDIGQGIAALLAMSPYSSVEENVEKMENAMRRVRTGEITYAARSVSNGNTKISAGDILALSENKIVCTGNDPKEVLMELLKFLVTEETEVISIIYGNGIQEEDVSGITATIGQLKPDCDIEVSYGGQPFKYFIVSVE